MILFKVRENEYVIESEAFVILSPDKNPPYEQLIVKITNIGSENCTLECPDYMPSTFKIGDES